MSYGKVRQQIVEQKAPESDLRCHAHGCPCRGTISLEGGKFCCAGHALIPSDKWQAATRSLNDHRWLIEFTDEIREMEFAHQDWRGFSVQFWTNQDEYCIPDPLENAVPYRNRMRGELLHRCGLGKRPAPRLPQPVKPAGRFQRATEIA